MKRCQFNFNNEVDTFAINVDEETGHVTVPGDDGQVMGEYDSVQQLAEIYAQARDVKPENLKNWVLLENGNVYSFVLRAGTAGLDVSEVEDRLRDVFTSLTDRFHALSIARAKEQVMSDPNRDLTDALVHCTETEIANAVYDAMSAEINGTDEAVAETPAEEVDTRTDLEKYIDSMEDTPGAIGFFATMVGLSVDAEKVDVLAALAGSFAFSNVGSLQAVFDNAVNDTINDGIGVDTVEDALTIITQTAVGVKDNDAKNRMIAGATMARRDKLNVSVDIVGEKHIRHTAELIPLNELEGVDLLMRDNVPYIVRFSDTIDAELEAERDAAAASEDLVTEQVTGAQVRQMMNGHQTMEPDGSYENDYITDDSEDEEEYE